MNEDQQPVPDKPYDPAAMPVTQGPVTPERPASPPPADATSQAAATPVSTARQVYPDPVKDTASQMDPVQQAALHISNKRAEDANKRVSERVKPLYIISILGIISALLSAFLGIGMLDSSSFGVVLLLISAAQIAMSVYLMAGRDQHWALLILKIFLVLQALSVIGSLGKPSVFLIGGILLVFTGYVYMKVRALPY